MKNFIFISILLFSNISFSQILDFSNAKEYSSKKVISILDENIFEYFNLKNYDTDLKKKCF